MPSLRRVVRAVALVALVACGNPEPRPATPDVTPLGRDRYFAVVGVGDRFVTGRTGPSEERPDDTYAVTTWEVVTPDSGRRQPLDLPPKAGCTKTSYGDLFALGSGSVGFARTCLTVDDKGKPSLTNDLVSYELASRRTRALMPATAGASFVRIGDDEFLALHDNSYCTHLTRYRAGAVVPLGIEIAGDGWPLDADGPSGEEVCESYGLVTLVAASPSGELALLASPDARGTRGEDRVDSPYSLYLVADGVARPVAKAPGRPRALTWSADGRTLYLSVDGDNAGVYSFARDGTMTLVTPTVAHDLAALDGSLVIIEDDDDLSLVRRLVVLPLTPRTTARSG